LNRKNVYCAIFILLFIVSFALQLPLHLNFCVCLVAMRCCRVFKYMKRIGSNNDRRRRQFWDFRAHLKKISDYKMSKLFIPNLLSPFGLLSIMLKKRTKNLNFPKKKVSVLFRTHSELSWDWYEMMMMMMMILKMRGGKEMNNNGLCCHFFLLFLFTISAPSSKITYNNNEIRLDYLTQLSSFVWR
jgi:hypothetical protein